MYLNSNTTAISLVDLVDDLPQIPTTNMPITVSLCGEYDSMSGVTSGSNIDISRLEILSSVGAPYPETEGIIKTFITLI